MDKDYSFLPHFIKEDIYVVNETLEVNYNTVPDISDSKVTEAEIANLEPKEQNNEEVEIKFEGQNNKNVTILYEHEHDLPTTEKELLLKILSAVKLSLNDIALINTSHNSSEQHYELFSQFKTNKLVAFGTDKHPLISEENEQYQIIVKDGVTILKSHNLKEISADVEKKKSLWTELKKMFPS